MYIYAYTFILYALCIFYILHTRAHTHTYKCVYIYMHIIYDYVYHAHIYAKYINYIFSVIGMAKVNINFTH